MDNIGDKGRKVLRAINNHYFPKDPYNVHKDELFFKVAGILAQNSGDKS